MRRSHPGGAVRRGVPGFDVEDTVKALEDRILRLQEENTEAKREQRAQQDEAQQLRAQLKKLLHMVRRSGHEVLAQGAGDDPENVPVGAIAPNDKGLTAFISELQGTVRRLKAERTRLADENLRLKEKASAKKQKGALPRYLQPSGPKKPRPLSPTTVSRVSPPHRPRADRVSPTHEDREAPSGFAGQSPPRSVSVATSPQKSFLEHPRDPPRLTTTATSPLHPALDVEWRAADVVRPVPVASEPPMDVTERAPVISIHRPVAPKPPSAEPVQILPLHQAPSSTPAPEVGKVRLPPEAFDSMLESYKEELAAQNEAMMAEKSKVVQYMEALIHTLKAKLEESEEVIKSLRSEFMDAIAERDMAVKNRDLAYRER
eukprot:Sspe_Gene.78498::Locus_49093_Transcript_1_1_Confidence_1.000_Length_1165::g.78498::m.78498